MCCGAMINPRARLQIPVRARAYGPVCAILELMVSLRQFIRTRRSGSLIVVCVAYALAIQVLMASVGLGMSAAAIPGQADFVICSFASAPPTDGDRQKPGPQPQCPFCFIAAQSGGQVATVGEAPAFPAYAGLWIVDALSGHISDRKFVPLFRRTTGDPRAPPTSSV
jgi:hypothetical protein